MRKKDKLYTANKHNLPLFATGVDRVHHNIFDLGDALRNARQNGPSIIPGISGNTNEMASKLDLSQAKLQAENNILKMGLGNMAGKGSGLNLGALDSSGLGSMGNQLAKSAISGGLSSAVGDGIANVGNVIGGAVGKIPGVGTLVGTGVQLFSGAAGGVFNLFGGSAVDQEKLDAANKGTEALNNYTSEASSFADLKGPMAQENVQDAYRGVGAEEKNNILKFLRNEAEDKAYLQLANNARNIADDQLNNALANYTAFGGKIKSNNDNSPMNILYDDTPMFAFGGDLERGFADYPTGLTHINAGGSHESNPNEGVQMGVDPEGVPNLVEEGEVVFNDYVYSNRIELDEEAKKAFHFGKKQNITYADAAKKLEKEISERPNDPISKAGFKAQMEELAQHQERQKQEMEAERAKEAFEALSPEEQVAIMQQAQQQEQMASEQAMQEQAMAEQQISPEEAAMMQQQAMQADGSQAMVGQKPPMMAEGGHLYANGGKELIYKLTGSKTDKEFDEWAKLHKIDQSLAWDDMLKDDAFRGAISRDNPALAHALGKGYDFGKLAVNNTNRYDLPAFNKVLEKYTMSKRQGNTKGKYAIDDKFGLGKYKTIKDLEDSENYQAYTKYLTDMLGRAKGIQWRRKDKNVSGDYDNIEFKDGKSLSREDYDALLTLAKTAQGTSTKDKGNPVPIFDMDTDEDGWYGLNDDAVDIVSRLRGDQKGGIFHLTPEKLNRGQMAQNWVINDDGSVEEIIGEIPTDWKAAGNYSWADADNDYTYNYYKRPVVKTKDDKKATDKEKRIAPNLKDERPRYLGLLDPVANLSLMAAGVGKPDYSELNAAVNKVNQAPALATYKPINNYLTYRPMDIWFEQNRLDANARATDRAIANNAAPIGTKMAGLLANGYNNQIASGELYRKDLEYNDAKREKVEAFNRGTKQFNADAFNQTSKFNASQLNNNRNYAAQLAMQAAREKLNTDASWTNSLYGNVSNIFKGLSDLGRENAEHNMVARMWADGIPGVATEDTYTSQGMIKKAKSKSKGGKIMRKKGLIF